MDVGKTHLSQSSRAGLTFDAPTALGGGWLCHRGEERAGRSRRGVRGARKDDRQRKRMKAGAGRPGSERRDADEGLREKQIPHFVRNDMGALVSGVLSPLQSGLPCAV